MFGAVVSSAEEPQDVGVESGRLGADESSGEESADSMKVTTSLPRFCGGATESEFPGGT